MKLFIIIPLLILTIIVSIIMLLPKKTDEIQDYFNTLPLPTSDELSDHNSDINDYKSKVEKLYTHFNHSTPDNFDEIIQRVVVNNVKDPFKELLSKKFNKTLTELSNIMNPQLTTQQTSQTTLTQRAPQEQIITLKRQFYGMQKKLYYKIYPIGTHDQGHYRRRIIEVNEDGSPIGISPNRSGGSSFVVINRDNNNRPTAVYFVNNRPNDKQNGTNNMITGFEVETFKNDDNRLFRDVHALFIPDNLRDEYSSKGLHLTHSSKDQDYVDWWFNLVEYINNLDTVDISNCDWNFYANRDGMQDVRDNAPSHSQNLRNFYLADHYIRIGNKSEISCIQSDVTGQRLRSKDKNNNLLLYILCSVLLVCIILVIILKK